MSLCVFPWTKAGGGLKSIKFWSLSSNPNGYVECVCKGALARPMNPPGHTKYKAAMIVVLFEGIFHAVIPRTISDKRCKGWREREKLGPGPHTSKTGQILFISEKICAAYPKYFG